MSTYSQGLIIGKFYPLHLGHVGLVERAAEVCGHLVVLVMASQIETIPLDTRVRWIRDSLAEHSNVAVIGVLDDAPVDYNSEIAWVAHHELLAAALRTAGIDTVEAVFSSEHYGEELAARLGAVSVLDDPDRRLVPMSGTAARADLPGSWPLLAEPTRLGLATRIIVVGAESSRTTTMAEALVAHYRAEPRFSTIRAVEEYGRDFTYSLFEEARSAAAVAGRPEPVMTDLVWTAEHFSHIASRQTRLENDAALACALVIADTDAFATTLWKRRYLEPNAAGSRNTAEQPLPRRDLYLITDHVDIPFEQDGWRDGEHIRPEMTRWFIDGLTERGLPWVLLRGEHKARLDYAIEAIDALLGKNVSFVSPVWADSTHLA